MNQREKRAFFSFLGKKQQELGHPRGLSTFIGVFTPTILTILGVIMYLRFGWVLGHGGLWETLIIVCLANAITIITALSLSAVATNGKVGVGGAYYIISRSLGIELGGAIGFPLFLSQALSVTLYAYGLAESLRIVWPGVPLLWATIVIICCVAALARLGADKALKAQIPIMGFIALSIAMVWIGASNAHIPTGLRASGPSGEYSFWALFAVFFPAVTGIMAGLGLSGDLEDPERSLPKGTILACMTGFLTYLAIPFILWYGADAATLRDEPMVWSKIAPLGSLLILPGLWGAIFSSAVGSVLGAPRTLQALANDHVVPNVLGRAPKGKGEPVLGMGVTLAIALGAVFLGGLNTVATVVTMFFLTVYGMVNLVAALEQWSQDPAWRPTIRVPWQLSLAGAFACFGVMLLISPLASMLAVTLEAVLYLVISRKEHRADWGNVWHGMYEALVRWALFQLSRRKMSARNWRPHIIVFVEKLEERLGVVQYADWFSQDRGLVTVCELVVGDIAELSDEISERRTFIRDTLREERLPAFGEVDVVERLDSGILTVVQANGMAGIASNTVMLGCPETPERLAVFLGILRRLELLGKSMILGRVTDRTLAKSISEREVHIWWGGLQRNGDLLLLLGYLLSRNKEWRGARFRVLSIASNELMKNNTEHALGEIMPELRMDAEVEVIVKPQDMHVTDIIKNESADADAVLFGLNIPEEGEEEEYAVRLLEMVEGIDNFFFVRNGSIFTGELI